MPYDDEDESSMRHQSLGTSVSGTEGAPRGLTTKFQPQSLEHAVVIDVIWASVTYNIPSVDLQGFRATLAERSPSEIIELGSGVTSRVIHYVTGAGMKKAVPSGTAVALKIFGQHDFDKESATISTPSKIAKTILREIKAFCNHILAGHPNIAKLLFLGWQRSDPFPILGIELGDHGTLDYIIKSNGPGLPKSENVHIILDIALGLQAIHQAGFQHGDLKPENIVVAKYNDSDRTVIAKLIDLGGTSQDSTESTGPRYITPLWSAPEVLHGDPDIDWHRADVYSFGLVAASLWARKNGGYGLSLLREPSSCFLDNFTRITMTDSEINDYRLLIKSKNDAILMLRQQLEEISMPDDEQDQVIQLLRPLLQAHFWLRPDSSSLLESLVPQALTVGRNILDERVEQETAAAEQLEDKSLQSQSEPDVEKTLIHTERQLEIIIKLFENHPAIVMDHLDNDIAETLSEDMTSTAFLQDLKKPLDDFTLRMELEPLGNLAQSVSTSMYCYMMAIHHFGIFQNTVDETRAQEWLCAAAQCGQTYSICMATLMLNRSEDLNENRLPSRAFLDILAMSGSELAMEILSCRWPSHYRMVGQIIRERWPAFSKAREALAKNPNFFYFDTFMAYADENGETSHELDMYTFAYTGVVEQFKLFVEALDPSESHDTSRLFHTLDNLPDHDAAGLSEYVLFKGGRLDYMCATYQPAFQNDQIGGRGQRSWDLPPLAASILRGKVQLARKILHLHKKHDIPIVNFSETLFISYTSLYPEIGEELIQLFSDKRSICQFLRPLGFPLSAELTIGEMLTLIFPSVVGNKGTIQSGYPQLIFMLKAIHGKNYDTAYETTIRSLVRHGATFAPIGSSYSPLSKCLASDDAIAVKVFFRETNVRDWDPYNFLKELPEGISKEGQNIESTAASYCLLSNSTRCLSFLLDEFPRTLVGTVFPGRCTLLHWACMFSDAKTIEALVEYNFDVMMQNEDSRTPLEECLHRGQTSSADILSGVCSKEQLETLLSRDVVTGRSVFFELLYAWAKDHEAYLVDSIFWVIKHDGAHFFGPNNMPVWTSLVGRERPFRYADQTGNKEILEHLFTMKEFSNNVNTERWMGYTLLQMAAWNGHVEIVKFLIGRNADVNAKLEYDPDALATHNLRFSQKAQSIMGFSICDRVAGRATFSNVPNVIKVQGQMATKRWVSDLEEIVSILLDNGCEYADINQEKAAALAELYQEALQTEGLSFDNDSDDGILDNVPDPTSPWPTPSSKSQILTAGGKTESPFSSRIAEKLHGFRGSSPQERQMRRQAIQEKEEAQRQYEQSKSLDLRAKLRYDLQMSKFEWRLPTEYQVIRSSQPDCDGSFSVFFKNRHTGVLSTQKPKLRTS